MEISELITIIREDYLDDTFSGWETASTAEKLDQFLWPDAALYRYITEAQRQACNRTDFLFSDSDFSVTLVAGSPTYQLNKKITFIEQVTFDGTTNVTHKSKAQFQTDNPTWRTDSGISDLPPEYTMRGHKLRIYPIPDAGDAGKILSIDAYHLPLDVIASDSDDLSIPDEYHRDLIWWVLYEAYSKQDAEGYDRDKGLMYLKQFNLAFGEYIPSEVRLNQLQEDASATIRPIAYNGNNQTNESGWYD